MIAHVFTCLKKVSKFYWGVQYALLSRIEILGKKCALNFANYSKSI